MQTVAVDCIFAKIKNILSLQKINGIIQCSAHKVAYLIIENYLIIKCIPIIPRQLREFLSKIGWVNLNKIVPMLVSN